MNISSLDTPKGDNGTGVKSAIPVIVMLLDDLCNASLIYSWVFSANQHILMLISLDINHKRTSLKQRKSLPSNVKNAFNPEKVLRHLHYYFMHAL